MNKRIEHSLDRFDMSEARIRRAVTADTDLRLCRFFGLSNGHWLCAQVAHDTEAPPAASRCIPHQ